ncbi:MULTISPECIES: hypothetical protein [unclassified Streptomyces]|uniref:hypothetical protein n=1 Tax=unclassified Streptomyces TaxID=2593676 RepID=UPI000B971648|nr:hypothetical protein [Streptomyces sp. FBKL.4005]MCE0446335.1 hypothetical protein [Streptomyces tricolor]OYP17672.1 hypothetical protein CFC35_26845 [Streptomyces sp. FBKL.4005]
MRSKRGLRRLVLPDGTEYLWKVRHRHTDGGPCTEVLTLHRAGIPTHIVFPGVAVGGYGAHSGLVSDRHGHSANLHEPGVVRAFVDELRRRGPVTGDVDGWALLPAVSRAAAATPGVPPGCPPGP